MTNELSILIWDRAFLLPVEYDCYDDENVTDMQKNAVKALTSRPECIADANGRKVFYCLKDEVDSNVEGSKDWTGSYITYAEYDGEMAYFEGLLTEADLQNKAVAEEKMITEDQLNDLSNKITVSENFMHIPTVTVKIVKIELINKK